MYGYAVISKGYNSLKWSTVSTKYGIYNSLFGCHSLICDILPNLKFSKINRSVIINKQFLTEINRKEKKCILRVNDENISFYVPPKYISGLYK